jgi:hypothetical protein
LEDGMFCGMRLKAAADELNREMEDVLAFPADA